MSFDDWIRDEDVFSATRFSWSCKVSSDVKPCDNQLGILLMECRVAILKGRKISTYYLKCIEHEHNFRWERALKTMGIVTSSLLHVNSNHWHAHLDVEQSILNGYVYLKWLLSSTMKVMIEWFMSIWCAMQGSPLLDSLRPLCWKVEAYACCCPMITVLLTTLWYVLVI